MRLYGSRYQDKARCGYGCCGGKLVRKYKLSTRQAQAAARKRARRSAHTIIEQEQE